MYYEGCAGMTVGSGDNVKSMTLSSARRYF